LIRTSSAATTFGPLPTTAQYRFAGAKRCAACGDRRARREHLAHRCRQLAQRARTSWRRFALPTPAASVIAHASSVPRDLRVERLRRRDAHLHVAPVARVEHAVGLVGEIAVATVDDRQHHAPRLRTRSTVRFVSVVVPLWLTAITSVSLMSRRMWNPLSSVAVIGSTSSSPSDNVSSTAAALVLQLRQALTDERVPAQLTRGKAAAIRCWERAARRAPVEHPVRARRILPRAVSCAGSRAPR
jgi:hypothetical protein